ncbi:MAG: hypothetical protein IT336_11925 [Thermomicrobiales bacterium]|nr:hypothetical protein [Thermomicrobiales bacterium]
MFRMNRALGVALIAAVLALLTPALASAHEHRDIADGRYSVVVGFSTEPAYSGFMNGLDFRVTDNSLATPAADGGEPTGAPVEGLESTLQAEIIYGDQKMTLVLEPRWRTPGAYDAWVVPTQPGDYSFRIFGTIGEVQIDETFTPGPETFSSVGDQAELQFPKATASNSAPVFGTVSGGGGFNTDAAAGGLAGLVIGAAGLFLVQRRRGQAPRLATVQAGAGD